MGTTRICPRCSGHFDVANWICPHCGAEFAPPRPAKPGWLQRMAPYPGALTKAVIGVTVAAYLVQVVLAGSFWNTPTILLIHLGALFRPLVEEGQTWRLVTPLLLHGGLLHVAFNMFALFQLGPLVERAFGRGRFLVMYLLCGIVASLASLLLGSGAPSVGASGAVCGMLGIMAAWGKRRGGFEGAVVKRVMIQWAVFILLYGLLAPRVDNWAHGGGFVAGFALGYAIGPKGFAPETHLRRTLWSAAALGVAVVTALCVVAAALNYTTERENERLRPKAREVGLTLGRAWMALETTYDKTHFPDPPGLIAEKDVESARQGLTLAHDTLEGRAASLGEGARRAVEDTRRALLRRLEEIEARVSAREPPSGSAQDLYLRAREAWLTYKRSIGLR